MPRASGDSVASEVKDNRFKRLFDAGKEKGYILYDDVNDLLPEDSDGGP